MLQIKHHTSFIEANDPETGQYNVKLISDDTHISDDYGGDWAGCKEKCMAPDFKSTDSKYKELFKSVIKTGKAESIALKLLIDTCINLQH